MRSSITQNSARREDIPTELKRILPLHLLRELEGEDVSRIEEIRVCAGRYPTVKRAGRISVLSDIATDKDEIDAIFRAVCGGSLYTHSETIKRGYVTLDGGIRVGIAGKASCEDKRIIGVHDVSSLCIRLPHTVRADASRLCALASRGSVLVYSRAGVGKTTLLRAAAIQLSDVGSPSVKSVAVVDTRGELCLGLDGKSLRIDVLSGYPKGAGIEIATRVLSPDVIICDEIGAGEMRELLFAANCGVSVIASAHAASLSELLGRGGMRELHTAGVFSYYAGISRSEVPFEFDYDIVSRVDTDAVFKNNG